MNTSHSDKKMKKTKLLYDLIASCYINIKNQKEADEVLKKIQILSDFDKKSKKSGVVDDFQIAQRAAIEDLKKVEDIKKLHIHNLKVVVDDAKDIITDSLADEIIKSVETYDEDGVNNSEKLYQSMQEETGISKQEAKKTEKHYSTDDYYSDIARTYSNIANGLQKTIRDLNNMLGELEVFLNDNKATNMQELVKEDKETVEQEVATEPSDFPKPEQKKETVQKKETKKEVNEDLSMQSLEEIEAGMSFSNNTYSDFDNEDFTQSESPNALQTARSLFGDTTPSKKQETDEDEVTRMKP